MIHERIPITPDWKALGLPAADDALLFTYLLDNSPEIDPDRRRPAVLICPGGGYGFTSDREAEALAVRWNALGYQSFILRYSVAPARFPTALIQLMTAVALIRSNAQAWHVQPEQIAVMGFSAGGHLAASLGCFSREDFCGKYGLPVPEVRPNAILLCYPVITSGPHAHRGSFENLLGDREAELSAGLSLETQVTGDTPPTFLWHTFDDDAVPVENSLLFASALRRQGVPFELHIYPHGVHGLSLAVEETAAKGAPQLIEPACQSWFGLAGVWLESLFHKII